MLNFEYQSIRIAIVLGIVISMLWYEKKNFSSGGVIVPGLMALFVLDRPLIVVYTLLIAFATLFIVKQTSNHVILFGRRRFSVIMLVNFGLAWGADMITNFALTSTVDFQVIGFVIPGLIANEMERQGIFNTLYTLIIITVLTLLSVLLVIGKWKPV
ncbi:Capsule biosynthesis CapC [uncultured archaeon]|nr:Capsule biosynthesis CapC [uncultured archaeon]